MVISSGIKKFYKKYVLKEWLLVREVGEPRKEGGTTTSLNVHDLNS